MIAASEKKQHGETSPSTVPPSTGATARRRVASVSEAPEVDGQMGYREEQRAQREKTSRALMEAALELAAEEGYASLSLRSVARKAGIAPTSFYRHFREMDELGLSLVEEAGDVLAACRERIQAKASLGGGADPAWPDNVFSAVGELSRPFATAFLECFADNNNLLRFFFQERAGSSDAVRRAIQEQADAFASDIADDLVELGTAAGIGWRNPAVLSEAVVDLAATEGLVMAASREDDPDAASARLADKLDMLLAGAVLDAHRS
ncbi:MAG: TetR family transcriptional regulator [Desulfatibacillaceae bacterium]